MATRRRAVSTGAEGAFAALTSPHRRRILRTLAEGERNNLELMTATALAQQTVSHHVKVLLLRDLVERHRRGKCNYYRLTEGGRRALDVMEALD